MGDIESFTELRADGINCCNPILDPPRFSQMLFIEKQINNMYVCEKKPLYNAREIFEALIMWSNQVSL